MATEQASVVQKEGVILETTIKLATEALVVYVSVLSAFAVVVVE